MDINKILHKEIESFASHDMRGKNIVLTGEMILSRRDMTLLIESVGAKVKTSVTKTTDLLVWANPGRFKGFDPRSKSNESNKMYKAHRLNIVTITDNLMIQKVNALQAGLLSCAENHITKNFIHADVWCKEFPFFINSFSWDVTKKIIFQNLSLFKFIDEKRYLYDNGIIVKAVWMDGSLFEHVPAVKKKNVQIVEAAMFADNNPKINLCKKLLGIQIKHLDLKNVSLKDREYIWKIYLEKTKLEDVLIIAKEREHFLQNTNSN